MAKKTYLCSDEHGHPWIVREGDPAFKLLVALPKAQIPVLFFDTLSDSGPLPQGVSLALLERLARVADADEDMRPVLVRYIALDACLRHLATVTIDL